MSRTPTCVSPPRSSLPVAPVTPPAVTCAAPPPERLDVGVDLAKLVIQLHWVDPVGGRVCKVAVKRAEYLDRLDAMGPCRVGMEACGGAHHWARRLQARGHEVRLLVPRVVKAYVTGNKSDAIDARAIWRVLRQGAPDAARGVAVKSQAQQAMLSLHRLRQQGVKARTLLINGLRAALAEFGVVMPRGRAALAHALPQALSELQRDGVDPLLLQSLRHRWVGVQRLDAEVLGIDEQLQSRVAGDGLARALCRLVGIGPLTATALRAAHGNAQDFATARGFAAGLGLVPAHRGSGGHTRLGGISKRGDAYLRSLLIHGARSALNRAAASEDAWLQALLQRRPRNVVVVALAHKLARQCWAVLRGDERGIVTKTSPD